MVYRLEMTPRPGVGQGTGKLIDQASQYFGFEIAAAAKSDVLTIQANISDEEMAKIASEIERHTKVGAVVMALGLLRGSFASRQISEIFDDAAEEEPVSTDERG